LIRAAHTLTKEHGRVVSRHLEVSTRIVPHLNWPGLAQVCRLRRRTRRGGKTEREVQYAITSLSPQRADAAQLLAMWRGHWGIENRVHWIRDTLWQEDRCRVKHPRGAHNLAAFRNTAINLLRLAKTPNLTATIRENAYRIDRLFARLGIMKL
jgi:predicted transposase YbfD/YdcC